MYSFVQDVPANREIYAQIKARLGDKPPAGLIAHLAMARTGGLRYVDVWESEEAWADFRDTRLEPIVADVLAGYSIPHDHAQVTSETVDVVDVWLG